MSGWCPSSLVCGMAVGVLLLSCQCSGAAFALLVPPQYSSVLLPCHATVPCQVCGVWVVSVCLCGSCGGVSSVHLPLVVVVGGAIVDGGGAVVVGGWHGE